MLWRSNSQTHFYEWVPGGFWKTLPEWEAWLTNKNDPLKLVKELKKLQQQKAITKLRSIL
jgi:hypothetical protein